jgi:hypothetical protein
MININYVLFDATGEIVGKGSNTPDYVIAEAAAGARIRQSDVKTFGTHRIDLATMQIVEIVPEPPTLAEVKTKRKADLAMRRYRAEVAGTMVDTISVQTDRASQPKLTGAAVAAMLDPNYTVVWKCADGTFRSFNHDQILAVAQAARAHVQACFNHEADVVDLIDAAADSAAVAAIDIETGWPA